MRMNSNLPNFNPFVDCKNLYVWDIYIKYREQGLLIEKEEKGEKYYVTNDIRLVFFLITKRGPYWIEKISEDEWKIFDVNEGNISSYLARYFDNEDGKWVQDIFSVSYHGNPQRWIKCIKEREFPKLENKFKKKFKSFFYVCPQRMLLHTRWYYSSDERIMQDSLKCEAILNFLRSNREFNVKHISMTEPDERFMDHRYYSIEITRI